MNIRIQKQCSVSNKMFMFQTPCVCFKNYLLNLRIWSIYIHILLCWNTRSILFECVDWAEGPWNRIIFTLEAKYLAAPLEMAQKYQSVI